MICVAYVSSEFPRLAVPRFPHLRAQDRSGPPAGRLRHRYFLPDSREIGALARGAGEGQPARDQLSSLLFAAVHPPARFDTNGGAHAAQTGHCARALPS